MATDEYTDEEFKRICAPLLNVDKAEIVSITTPRYKDAPKADADEERKEAGMVIGWEELSYNAAKIERLLSRPYNLFPSVIYMGINPTAGESTDFAIAAAMYSQDNCVVRFYDMYIFQRVKMMERMVLTKLRTVRYRRSSSPLMHREPLVDIPHSMASKWKFNTARKLVRGNSSEKS